MSLESLITINPALYNQLIQVIRDFIIEVSKYNRDYNSDMFGFRMVRPDDMEIGGTKDTYICKFPALSTSSAFIGNAERDRWVSRVGTGNGLVYFGWICKVDFKDEAFLKVVYEGIEKRNIKTSIVYEQQHPQHIYYDIQGIRFFRENDKVEFLIENNSPQDYVGEVYPIVYKIAPKQQLWDADIGNEIAWEEIPDDIDKAMKEDKNKIQLNQIQLLLTEMKEMYHPFDYVEVKDTPFSSHTEIKMRLDPSMKNYLENLKNGKVCPYCGEKVYSISRFCLSCGCPVDYKNEQEQLYQELKK